MLSETLARRFTELWLPKVSDHCSGHRQSPSIAGSFIYNKEWTKSKPDGFPRRVSNQAFPSDWLGFTLFGFLCSFVISPRTLSQSIFFISISSPSPEGSLMYQALRYPWRMPRGSPRHVKVLNFAVALMPSLRAVWSALGGAADYKDMQTHKLSTSDPPVWSLWNSSG